MPNVMQKYMYHHQKSKFGIGKLMNAALLDKMVLPGIRRVIIIIAFFGLTQSH